MTKHFYAKIGWNWFLVLETILNFVNVVSIFFIITFPWKKACPIIWTNVNCLHPVMFCAKCGGKWPAVSIEEDFYVSSMYCFFFVSISPWKKTVWPVITKKIESPIEWIGSSGCKKGENVKKLTTTTKTTDKGVTSIRAAERYWIFGNDIVTCAEYIIIY